MVNKRLINTGEAIVPFDPLQNFETVTYTGNGSTQKITGYIRKGAAFNGSSSVIQASGLNQFFNNWNDASWSAWINTTDTSAQFIVSSSTDSQNYKLLGDIDSNKFRILVRKSGAVYLGASTTDVNDGNWHHIAASYDNSTGTVKGYVDGSEEISFTTGGSSSGTFTVYDFCIGANKQNSTVYNPLDGKLDQVRIFDKAISSGEVDTLEAETYASSTKSTTDIFGDGSGIALYELDEDAYSSNFEQAAVFSGSSSSYITASGLGITGNTSFTISTWVNTTSSGAKLFFFLGNGTINSSLYMSVESGGVVRVGDFGTDLFSSTTSVNDGNWHHIALTSNGTTTKLYIDGSESNSLSYTWAISTDNMELGRGTSSYYYNGKLDQVRIYSSALDSTDVEKLYKESADVPTANLLPTIN